MSETFTQDICLVEKILEKRTNAETGVVEYLIRWQGEDAQGKGYEDSWEPEQNILGQELIEEFERRQEERRPQRRRSIDRSNGADTWQDVHKGFSSRLDHTTGATPHKQSLRHSSLSSFSKPRFTHPYIPHGSSSGPYTSQFFDTGPYPAFPRHLSSSHGSYYHPIPYPFNVRPAYARYDPSKSLKRKATSEAIGHKAITDPNKLDSGLQNASNQDATNTDDAKRAKAGDHTHNRDQAVKYHARRQPLGTANNGQGQATFRLLSLDNSNEKAFFRSVIEKSTLVSDAVMRTELLKFLRNPKKPDLDEDSILRTSDAWLIEIKKQTGASGSLFLAIDVLNGIAKALFIPEHMLEQQRLAHPEQGIVIKDPHILAAIMQGDINGSGLYEPSTSVSNDMSSQQPLVPSVTEPQKPEINGYNAGKELSSNQHQQSSAIQCEWNGCQQSFPNLMELSSHIQQQHLSELSITRSPSTSSSVIKSDGSTSVVKLSPDVESKSAQEIYSSLQTQLAETKSLAMKMDKRLRESQALYLSAKAASTDEVKRLEARLEWEMKKWDAYQSQKKKMRAHSNVTSDLNTGSGSKADDRAESESMATSEVPNLEDHKLDMPMGAQSANSIRDIQRALAAAKKSLVRLEDENMKIYDERRAFDKAIAKLDEELEQAAAQLKAAETREQIICDELKSRSQNIEGCKTAMEQEQLKSQEKMKQLQALIGNYSQSGTLPIAVAPTSTSTSTSISTSTPTPISTSTPTPISTSTPTPISTSAPTPAPSSTPIQAPSPAPIPTFSTSISLSSPKQQDLAHQSSSLLPKDSSEPSPDLSTGTNISTATSFIDMLTKSVNGSGSNQPYSQS
ncbi:hypothetical protein BX616_003039 [Lobosporangium transversale]|uniref:Chromo domain-containing protein n=1 Tax=Lobosporangium transversale TaxID=64571 RepID=A0A1Y2GV11_9FUNG|nr:hypothetical protein BCR41DRAFT_420770 [Lobosporangium transversale]KAF9916712.1 hypothetical protein BX616_003039 [Lobosporangium transversale]ORZ21848.1 hypothetical protein BCR41DRAFT_420770 [Lobosporangium transversale]|eukprot:XP_021883099.1 hypothetical protein BCR41DRAFT_420770 [Lobosporangium transversale]